MGLADYLSACDRGGDRFAGGMVMDWAAKVPNMPERLEMLRLYRALQDTEAVAYAAATSEMSDDDFAKLSDAEEAAIEAYSAFDAPPLLLDDETSQPVLCALSGAPIFQDDEILRDEIDGMTILRMLVAEPRMIGEADHDALAYREWQKSKMAASEAV